jgi:hypothetical protein
LPLELAFSLESLKDHFFREIRLTLRATVLNDEFILQQTNLAQLLNALQSTVRLTIVNYTNLFKQNFLLTSAVEWIKNKTVAVNRGFEMLKRLFSASQNAFGKYSRRTGAHNFLKAFCRFFGHQGIKNNLALGLVKQILMGRLCRQVLVELTVQLFFSLTHKNIATNHLENSFQDVALRSLRKFKQEWFCEAEVFARRLADVGTEEAHDPVLLNWVKWLKGSKNLWNLLLRLNLQLFQMVNVFSTLNDWVQQNCVVNWRLAKRPLMWNDQT